MTCASMRLMEVLDRHVTCLECRGGGPAGGRGGGLCLVLQLTTGGVIFFLSITFFCLTCIFLTQSYLFCFYIYISVCFKQTSEHLFVSALVKLNHLFLVSFFCPCFLGSGV